MIRITLSLHQHQQLKNLLNTEAQFCARMLHLHEIAIEKNAIAPTEIEDIRKDILAYKARRTLLHGLREAINPAQ